MNPDSYTTLLSSRTVSYSNGASQPSAHRYAFNITNAVKGWKLGNYMQSKGLLFKAPASVESGGAYIKRTFSSYNRSTYKPSLTVNYDVGESQGIANGTYYLNGKEGGGYLRYASGAASAKSGLISSLGNSIRWELQSVDGGYVLRSRSDMTKYLAVPSSTASTSVTVETVSESALPSRCIWTISVADGGGCLLKSAYNGKYLYSYGTVLNTTSTLGTSGTSTYNARVWRIITQTNMVGKELGNGTRFYWNNSMMGYTNTIKYKTNPSNAAWADESDFTYQVQDSTIISINTLGVITPKKTGNTVVNITHKVTDLEFEMYVNVNSQQTYKGTLSRWSDIESDVIGFWSESPSVYEENIESDNTAFHFDEGVDSAIDQWNDVLNLSMTMTSMENNADIVILGGTRQQLAARGHTVSDGANASTVMQYQILYI